MSKIVPKIGDRVAITDPDEHLGCTFLDVTETYPDKDIKGLGVHPTKTMRPPMRISEGCYDPTVKPVYYEHIDGALGKEGSGYGEKGKGKGKGKGSGDAKGQGQGQGNGGASEMDESRIREIAREEAGELDGELLEQVKEAVEASLDARAKADVTIQIKELPPVKVEGLMHDSVPRVLRLIAAGVAKRNVLLVGPAGCGKTTLARQVAIALGFDPMTQFASISCSPGMSESKLLGRVIPKLTGEDSVVYESTPMVEVYMNGGVILLDELDNADPSVLVSLNTMLDNGMVNLPSGELAIRHKDTVIIASANTFGHGADRIYVGRNQLDGSTLDRFVGATLNLDYDTKLETTLVPEAEIRDRIWNMRSKARAAKLRRIVSTRMMVNVRLLMLGVGDTLNQAIAASTPDWTEQDKRTCGIA